MKNRIDSRAVANVVGMRDAQPIRIMGFVDGDVIPPSCYDKPYRLEPGKSDDKAYDVLRDVMHRTRKVGLVSVVIEKKQALAAVIPIGRTLVLNVLRLASALVPGTRAANVRAKPARIAGQEIAAGPASSKARSTASTARKRPTHLALAEPPKQPAARMVGARKAGEVIDLAVRRSSKRAAQGRGGKSQRARDGGVATLHELRRKAGATRSREIQLA